MSDAYTNGWDRTFGVPQRERDAAWQALCDRIARSFGAHDCEVCGRPSQVRTRRDSDAALVCPNCL